MNNLQPLIEIEHRPSKSGVAGSSPAGPTKESTGCGFAAALPLPEIEGRGSLNAVRTLLELTDDNAALASALAQINDLYCDCLWGGKHGHLSDCFKPIAEAALANRGAR